MTGSTLSNEISSLRDQTTLLRIRNLGVEFRTSKGWRPAIHDVSLDIRSNEVLGLVGESGSGKSVTAMSILGLLPPRASRLDPRTSIRIGDAELAHRSSRELDRIRGARIGMIFQEPMSSLNPAYTIGEQIAETVRRHLRTGRRAANSRAVQLLDQVGIPNAARNALQYPHHFSGGMRQRAMIAMALACEPELLIADEPTTALDVTVQAMILDLLGDLQRERAMSILLITHDLGVVAELADRVGVMYAGELVELDESESIFGRPLHPYTSGLLGSVLRIDDNSPFRTIPGSVPGILEDVVGCRFAARCSFREDRCTAGPVALTYDGSREVRCLRSGELQLEGLGS